MERRRESSQARRAAGGGAVQLSAEELLAQMGAGGPAGGGDAGSGGQELAEGFHDALSRDGSVQPRATGPAQVEGGAVGVRRVRIPKNAGTDDGSGARGTAGVPRALGPASSGEYGQGQSSLDGAAGVPQSSLDGAAMASQCALGGAAMAPQCALGGAAMAPQCALGGAAMGPQCALGGAAMASQCALGGAAMAPQCALGGAAMASQCALGGAAMAPQCALGGAAMAPQCALGGAAMESQCALGGAAMVPRCALGGVAMAPQCHLDGATGTPQRALVGAIRAPQSSLGGGASEAPRPLVGAADAPQGALRGVGNSPDVVRGGPVGTAGSSPSVGLLERPAGVLVEKIWERITGASDDANDASRFGAQSSGGTVGASGQGPVGIGMIGDLVGTFDPAGMLGSGVESFDISTPRGTAGALGVEQPPGLVVEGRVMEEPQIVPFWSPERKAYERMGCEWEKNQRMSEGGHGSVSYQTGSVPALSAGLGVGQGFGVQPQNESPPRDVLMDPVELFRIRCMRDAEERFRRGLQQIACPEQNSAGTSGGSFATAVEETEGFVPPPPPGAAAGLAT